MLFQVVLDIHINGEVNIIAVLSVVGFGVSVWQRIAVGVSSGDNTAVDTGKVLIVVSLNAVSAVAVRVGKADDL